MPYDRSGGGERRARLGADVVGPMSPVTRSRASSKRRKAGSTKVRVVKGRVKLRVPGYPGLQSLSPALLVKYIGSAKLRVAAKKVLRKTKKGSGKRKKGRRKARKGKKRRKKKAGKRRKRKGKKSKRRKARRKRRRRAT